MTTGGAIGIINSTGAISAGLAHLIEKIVTANFF